MATKHQVHALHVAHPDWTAPDIASQLGCLPAYVRTAARRNGWSLPTSKGGCVPSRLRRAAPRLLAALKRAEEALGQILAISDEAASLGAERRADIEARRREARAAIDVAEAR